MGALAVVNELLNRHQKLRRLLVRSRWTSLARTRLSTATQENESGAAHSYMPDIIEPESACALSSCLWEVSLLQRHAHPSVAALATHVASLPVEDAAPPAPYGSSTVEVTMRCALRPARSVLTRHLVSMAGGDRRVFDGAWRLQARSSSAEARHRSPRQQGGAAGGLRAHFEAGSRWRKQPA